jgi:DNA ligase (NAD+)
MAVVVEPQIIFTPDLIDETTIVGWANTLNQSNFKRLLEYLTENYHNDQSLVSDDIYDQLVDVYEAKYQPFAAVGAEPRGEKVKLPYYLGSLRKLKKDNELDTWIKTHPGPYILEDKIDGLTLLLINNIDTNGRVDTRLYTRGGGYQGIDVSHLIGYLGLPKLTSPLAIRGEVVMNKDVFDRVGAGFKNPRNLVSGIVNSKKQFKPELARALSFYAYRIINTTSSPEEQMMYLQKLGFLTPTPAKANTIDRPTLENYFKIRKQQAPYEIDGIVIYQNIHEEYPVGEAPRHVVAFKTDTESVETVVNNVTWEPSKNRLLKPVVHYQTVTLSGADLSKSTGYNARFIITNSIGPGARIMITRSGDVIPKIISVISPAPGGPSYPDPNFYGQYGWNEGQVEFVLLEDNDKVIASKIKHFLTTLDVKNVGPKRIDAIVGTGIKDIKSLVEMTPQQFATVPGFGTGLSTNVYTDLHDKITNANLATVMDASGLFPNVGERRFEKILETYPNLLEMSTFDRTKLIGLVQQIKGFDKLATVIVDNLPGFVAWLKSIPQITTVVPGIQSAVQPQQTIPIAVLSPAFLVPQATQQTMTIQPAVQPTTTQNLAGVSVVFSGFRDKPLERDIIMRGGKVTTSVSGNTKYLIMKDINDRKGKALEAERRGIPLISIDQFRAQFLS